MSSHVSSVPPPQTLDRKCTDLAGSALFQWYDFNELTGHNAKSYGTGDGQEITYFRIHHFDLWDGYFVDISEASRFTMAIAWHCRPRQANHFMVGVPGVKRPQVASTLTRSATTHPKLGWNSEYSTQRIIFSCVSYCVR